MISIVDYGLGNIRAFLNAFKRLNIEATTAASAEALAGATRIILPGVGHFDNAMQRLNASGMRPVLEELVLRDRVPILGVCVGMQMLARSSDEGGSPGLGWIPGHVRHFASWPPTNGLALPHMGWNDTRPARATQLFTGLDDAQFYFLHSLFFECDRPSDVAAVTHYGAEFACAVEHENICGVQFHPEKSHGFGARLLQNFAGD